MLAQVIMGNLTVALLVRFLAILIVCSALYYLATVFATAIHVPPLAILVVKVLLGVVLALAVLYFLAALVAAV